MKRIILQSLAFVIFIASCSIKERKYLPGYHVDWNNKTKDRVSHINPDTLQRKFIQNEPESELTIASLDEGLLIEPQKSYKDNATPDPCDLIILKNGEELSGIVSEIGLTEVKYKKCSNLSGPVIVIKKEDVFIIKYANGTKDVFKEEIREDKKQETKPQNKKEMEPFSLLSFMLGIIGIPIGLFASALIGIILAIIAISFGIIGIVKLKNNPDKFSGKGLAVTGLFTGILLIALFATLIAIAVTLF